MAQDHDYPWRILEIDETDDKKAIKKAYAVLIKQYKPDEYPEKFQEIQAAYKMALSMRDWPTQEAESLDESERTTTVVETEDFELSRNELKAEEPTFEQQDIIDSMLEQLHQMAFAPLVIKEPIENWKFIEDFYKIEDLSIKPLVAQKIFEKVAEYNLFQMKNNGTLLIQAKIINYFNVVFKWSESWQEYQQIFPQSHYESIFYYLDNDVKFLGILDSIASPLLRVWAFAIDMLLAGAILIPILLLTHEPLPMWTFIVILVLLKSWREVTSDKHSSFGKDLNRIIVLDEFGNYCTKKMAVIRLVYLNVLLVPIFYLPLLGIESIQNSPIFLICLALVIALNLMSLMINKVLLHDSLSRTWVISR